MPTYSERCINQTNSWDEQLESSFQYSTYTGYETPFHSDLEELNMLLPCEKRNQNNTM